MSLSMPFGAPAGDESLTIRADSGFCRERAVAWCELEGVDFAQPRQDDPVEYLIQHVAPEQLEQAIEDLRIDLSPPGAP